MSIFFEKDHNVELYTRVNCAYKIMLSKDLTKYNSTKIRQIRKLMVELQDELGEKVMKNG